MPKLNGKIVSAVRVNGGDLGRVVGNSLRTLRSLAGLTQNDLAERLNVGQAAISKIEHRGDVQISSLKKYVEALGATLRIEAAFDAEASLTLRNAGHLKPLFKTKISLFFRFLVMKFFVLREMSYSACGRLIPTRFSTERRLSNCGGDFRYPRRAEHLRISIQPLPYER